MAKRGPSSTSARAGLVGLTHLVHMRIKHTNVVEKPAREQRAWRIPASRRAAAWRAGDHVHNAAPPFTTTMQEACRRAMRVADAFGRAQQSAAMPLSSGQPGATSASLAQLRPRERGLPRRSRGRKLRQESFPGAIRHVTANLFEIFAFSPPTNCFRNLRTNALAQLQLKY